MFSPFTKIFDLSFISEDERIPTFFNVDLEFTVFGDFDIHVVGWRLVLYGTFVALPFSTDYFYFCAVFLVHWDFGAFYLLVFGFLHLVF